MAQSYNRKKSPQRSSRASSQRAKKKSNRTMPGWVLLFAGMLTGLFIAFLIYLAGLTPDVVEMKREAAQIATNQEKPKPAIKKPIVKQKKAAAKEKESARFEFYTILPESEVIVPSAEQQTTKKLVKNNSNNQVGKHTYLLQAGSFRNLADADRLRAQLLLMGLDAKMHKVSLGNGEMWHRVQVGPYQSQESLNKAQAKLTASNIETLLLKLK